MTKKAFELKFTLEHAEVAELGIHGAVATYLRNVADRVESDYLLAGRILCGNGGAIGGYALTGLTTPRRREIWTYRGINVHPADVNGSGVRWYAYTPEGNPDTPPVLRADTKEGMKVLIKDMLNIS